MVRHLNTQVGREEFLKKERKKEAYWDITLVTYVNTIPEMLKINEKK